MNTLSAIGDLISASADSSEKSQKKAFEANKSIKIAQAIISTYAGANAAFTSAAESPLTTIFPAYPFVAAAAAAASGLANVAKIKSTKFQSSGSSGGGVSSPTRPSTGPGSGGSTEFSSQTPSNIIQQGGAFSNTKSQRIFVVESDITNTQSRVKVIQDNSNGQF